MISYNDNIFKLDTPNTTYLIRISETGHPEHLYYGPYVAHIGDVSSYVIYSDLRMPTIVNYSNETPRRYLAMMPLEMSSAGKGDLREPVFTGEWGEDGNTVFDFLFESWRIGKDNSEVESYVSSLGKDHPEIAPHLPASRKDDCEELLVIRSLYSMQLDLIDDGVRDSDI